MEWFFMRLFLLRPVGHRSRMLLSVIDLDVFSFQSFLQRITVLSDLLIAVSKSERQEARMKTQQDSLRLGNVGVIRYCFISKLF